MKYTNIILFSLVLSLSLASCKKDDPTGDPTSLSIPGSAEGRYAVAQECGTSIDANYYLEITTNGSGELVQANFADFFDEVNLSVDRDGRYSVLPVWELPANTSPLTTWDIYGATGAFSSTWDTLEFSFRMQRTDRLYIHDCQCLAIRQ